VAGKILPLFFVFVKMLDLPYNEKAKVGAENFPMGVSRWRWYRSAENISESIKIKTENSFHLKVIVCKFR